MNTAATLNPSLSLATRATRVPRWAACLGLVAVLALLTFTLDTDGTLGTDSGGKVATVLAMSERGDWNPSLGYWAEASDPDGSLHPFFGTRRTDAGWINVTSLPMIFATRPVVDLIGIRGVYLVPILGSLLTCLAAGSLGRRFGAPSWHLGFAAAATASPVWVYGLDFWEHSMGLALMLWGFVGLLTGMERLQIGPAAGLTGLAGLSFGLAATMRQEALVFGFVAGLVCLLGGDRNLSIAHRLVRSTAMAAGALLPLIVNHALEAAVYGEATRTGRAVGTVQQAGAAGLVRRLGEGVIITASPINLLHPLSLMMAALVAGGLIWLGLAVLRGTDTQRPLVLCGLVVLLQFLRLVTIGPIFVPGMLAAVPTAGLGIAAAIHFKNRLVLVLSLAPIPLVWATMYPGAAIAQWAGRYILASGLVLTVFGIVSVAGRRPRLAAGFLAANLVLALIGTSWLVIRTRDFGSASRQLADVDAPAVVFTDSFIARESAPLGLDQRWLSAERDDDRIEAAELLAEQGIDRFAVVSFDAEGDLEFPGYVVGEVGFVAYGSFRLILTDYRAE